MKLGYKVFLGGLAVILVAAAVAAAVHFGSRSTAMGEIAAFAPLDPECDIQQGPCRSRFSDGAEVTLSVTPRPFRGLQPLEIRIDTQGLEPSSVQVDFRGVGMDMGFNRPSLNEVAPGSFSGPGMISVCVLQRMAWEATVLLTTEGGILAAPFRFETVRP